MGHRVLLVQEDQADADAILDALASSRDSLFEVEWVQRSAEVLEQFSERGSFTVGGRELDAVLLDLFLPDSSGIETFDRVFDADRQVEKNQTESIAELPGFFGRAQIHRNQGADAQALDTLTLLHKI